jgi:hypothetical protein
MTDADANPRYTDTDFGVILQIQDQATGRDQDSELVHAGLAPAPPDTGDWSGASKLLLMAFFAVLGYSAAAWLGAAVAALMVVLGLRVLFHGCNSGG